MSIHLMSLVWEIQFPTQTQKMVALKLADYASEDGGGIYPSNQTLANQVGCNKRSIQTVMKALQKLGLIHQLRSAGIANAKTNQWRMDVDLVIKLATGELGLTGNFQAVETVEKGGENTASPITSRVKKAALGVKPASWGGETQTTQTLLNHKIEPLDACASARENSRTTPARTMIELMPSDLSWSDWMDHFDSLGRSDLAQDAKRNGVLQVTSRFPTEANLRQFLSAGPRSYTDRKLGEGDAA